MQGIKDVGRLIKPSISTGQIMSVLFKNASLSVCWFCPFPLFFILCLLSQISSNPVVRSLDSIDSGFIVQGRNFALISSTWMGFLCHISRLCVPQLTSPCDTSPGSLCRAVRLSVTALTGGIALLCHISRPVFTHLVHVPGQGAFPFFVPNLTVCRCLAGLLCRISRGSDRILCRISRFLGSEAGVLRVNCDSVPNLTLPNEVRS